MSAILCAQQSANNYERASHLVVSFKRRRQLANIAISSTIAAPCQTYFIALSLLKVI